jgi:hypothetical protein
MIMMGWVDHDREGRLGHDRDGGWTMIVMGKPLEFRRFPHHDHERGTQLAGRFSRNAAMPSCPSAAAKNVADSSTSAGRSPSVGDWRSSR